LRFGSDNLRLAPFQGSIRLTVDRLNDEHFVMSLRGEAWRKLTPASAKKERYDVLHARCSKDLGFGRCRSFAGASDIVACSAAAHELAGGLETLCEPLGRSFVNETVYRVVCSREP